MAEQTSKQPIPDSELEKIIDKVERAVAEELEKNAPLWKHVGTRVGYYVPEGDDNLREFKVDRGDVDPLDDAPIIEPPETDPTYWEEETRNTGPLPQTFVIDQIAWVEQRLKEFSGQHFPVQLGLVMRHAQGAYAKQGGACKCPKKRWGWYSSEGLNCTTNKCA